jgi:polyhydroxyalkanoate synthesis regulator phasin
MEEKECNSDESMEKMLSNMGNYMVNKLKQRTESIKKRLEDVKKSDKKNKVEIENKLEELIEVMNKITEKTKLQTDTQTELIELTEKMAFLDEEIDKLLIC